MFILNMDENIALALAIVPPTVYLILCFKLKSDTQINIAAIMSVLYAFLMAGTILSIIGNVFCLYVSFSLIGSFLFSVIFFRLAQKDFLIIN